MCMSSRKTLYIFVYGYSPSLAIISHKREMVVNILIIVGRRSRDRMVVGFTAPYVIRVYHH